MKIVAKVNSWKYIVEMELDELNKITGENRNSNDGGYDPRPYRVDEKFSVVKTFAYLKGIFEKKKELFDTARNLRSMADMIESMKVPEEDANTE